MHSGKTVCQGSKSGRSHGDLPNLKVAAQLQSKQLGLLAAYQLGIRSIGVQAPNSRPLLQVCAMAMRDFLKSSCSPCFAHILNVHTMSCPHYTYYSSVLGYLNIMLVSSCGPCHGFDEMPAAAAACVICRDASTASIKICLVNATPADGYRGCAWRHGLEGTKCAA